MSQDSPAYVRDRTPLKKGEITTLALRDEFRRNPALPILIGDNVFIRGVRRGIEQGEYVYRRGELVFGPGDPAASIRIDEQSLIFTMARAKNAGIWPRKRPDEPISTTERTGEDRGAGTVEERGKGRPMEKPPESFTAEGLLKEALIRLWELARAEEGGEHRRLDHPHVRGRRRLPALRRRGCRVRGGQDTSRSGAATRPGTAVSSNWIFEGRCRTPSR